LVGKPLSSHSEYNFLYSSVLNNSFGGVLPLANFSARFLAAAACLASFCNFFCLSFSNFSSLCLIKVSRSTSLTKATPSSRSSKLTPRSTKSSSLNLSHNLRISL